MDDNRSPTQYVSKAEIKHIFSTACGKSLALLDFCWICCWQELFFPRSRRCRTALRNLSLAQLLPSSTRGTINNNSFVFSTKPFHFEFVSNIVLSPIVIHKCLPTIRSGSSDLRISVFLRDFLSRWKTPPVTTVSRYFRSLKCRMALNNMANSPWFCHR